MVEEVQSGGTYLLRELDGKRRRRPETGDRLKLWIPPVVSLLKGDDGGPVPESKEEAELFDSLAEGVYQDCVDWCWDSLLHQGTMQALTLVSKDCCNTFKAGVETGCDAGGGVSSEINFRVAKQPNTHRNGLR